MKKICLPLIFLLFITNCFAQNEYKKHETFGFSFTLHDFKTPAEIKSKSLVNVIREKQLFKTENMEAGIGLNYLKGLNNYIDFVSSLGVSSFSSSLNTEISAGINLKLLTDEYVVVPFIDAGIGASTFSGYYGAFIPIGTGIQINISKEVFFLLNTQYRIPVTENATSHLFYGLTVTADIGKEKK